MGDCLQTVSNFLTTCKSNLFICPEAFILNISLELECFLLLHQLPFPCLNRSLDLCESFINLHLSHSDFLTLFWLHFFQLLRNFVSCKMIFLQESVSEGENTID